MTARSMTISQAKRIIATMAPAVCRIPTQSALRHASTQICSYATATKPRATPLKSTATAAKKVSAAAPRTASTSTASAAKKAISKTTTPAALKSKVDAAPIKTAPIKPAKATQPAKVTKKAAPSPAATKAAPTLPQAPLVAAKVGAKPTHPAKPLVAQTSVPPAPIQLVSKSPPSRDVPQKDALTVADTASPEYKSAARKWVSAMIALPILFVTSYYLFDRLAMGNPQKSWASLYERESKPDEAEAKST